MYNAKRRKVGSDYYEFTFEINDTKVSDSFPNWEEKEQYKQIVDFAFRILDEASSGMAAEYIKKEMEFRI